MARKKEARGKAGREEPAQEESMPEQIGVDEEGQPEFSLQPQQKEKKDPTAIEFKHSYVVESADTKDLGKKQEGGGKEQALKKEQRKGEEISEKEREEDYWYVG